MGVERALLCVTFLTKLTDKGPLPSMLSHVIVQIALSPGSVVTGSAFEGLFSGMNSHMDFYTLLLGETFPTNLAVVWSLAGMSPKREIKINIH